MAGVEVGTGGGKRSVNHEINMVPFIDLLLVTIAFLLVTAVWVSYSRIETSASTGVHEGPVDPPTDKALHLLVTDSEVVLSWRHGSTTVSETRLSRGDQRELAAAIEKQWKLHGGHQDPSDRKQDRCVLHTENQLPFKEMVAVMDAVHAAKRKLAVGGQSREIPAFSVAFASR